MKSFSPCLIWLNSNAEPIACAVQLPSSPWSQTDGIFEPRRSTFFGNFGQDLLRRRVQVVPRVGKVRDPAEALHLSCANTSVD